MSHHSFLIFLIGLIACIGAPSWGYGGGEHPSPESLAEMIQGRYEKAVDIKADFFQETLPAGAHQGMSSEGVVFFKRPQLMRWEYRLPEPQLIVTSGEDVYIYEEEANQVMILPRDQFLSTEISRAFFFGQGNLREYFLLESPDSDWPRAEWTLRLTPRDAVPQVKALWLTVSPESHFVEEMWLEDQLGGRIHLVFKNIQVNSGVGATLFRFAPPPGVEVYRTDGS